eukprot:RCo012016
MGHKFSKVLPVPGAEDDKEDTPGLFLGTVDYIVQSSILTDLGIKAVVTLLSEVPPETYPVLEERGISNEDHLAFPLEDSSDRFLSLFHGCGVLAVVDFIHHRRLQGKPVLVHCDAGLTRSPAVVTAYLMKNGPELHNPNPLSFREASQLVIQRRGPKVDLRLFERDLLRLEGFLERCRKKFPSELSSLHLPSGGPPGLVISTDSPHSEPATPFSACSSVQLNSPPHHLMGLSPAVIGRVSVTGSTTLPSPPAGARRAACTPDR